MRRTLLVMRYELLTVLSRPGYLFFAFGVPLLAVLILAGVRLAQSRTGGGEQTGGGGPAVIEIDTEGYVDQSGLVRTIPENLSEGRLLSFADEAGAQQALRDGEIAAYYLIPADYLQSGLVYYVYPDTRSYLSNGQDWVISWTLMFNLLPGNPQLADRVWNPIRILDETVVAPQAGGTEILGEDCSRPGSACESNDLVRYIPIIMVAVFYAAFMSSSSMLFNSVGTEKENRTIEVLLVSVTPRELLTGKTFGLGVAGLLQTVVWLGGILILFNLGGATLNLPENFRFPVYIAGWSLVFFLGGYLLYASLMAGAGAMVPKMKEAGVANVIAMTPLMIGYMVGLIAPIADASSDALPVALSLFPLTAPVVMVMRLCESVVPPWQLWLSAALTYASAYLALRAVAAMFHAQNLLSGEAFSARRYFQALLGKG